MLLHRREIKDELIAAIVADPDPTLRRVLAQARALTGAQRVRLARDPDARVRQLVAADTDDYGARAFEEPLPDEAGQLLARDEDVRVRRALADRRRTPDPTMAILATDTDAMVRRLVCLRWRDAPIEVVDALLADAEPAVREAARHNFYRQRPELVEALVDEQLAKEPAPKWHCQLYADAPLDRPYAQRLADHPNRQIRASVAENPTLPPDLVAQLSTDRSRLVRRAVSLRPELTEARRAALDVRIAPDEFIRPIPAWITDATDPAVMRRCVTSAYLGLRRCVAYNQNLPADLVAILAADDDFMVRLILCENHPHAPGELLVATALESEFITRFDQIHRPNFPRTGLTHLAESADPVARALVALDRDAAPELIERLSHDEAVNVRVWMAGDARLSSERIIELLDDRATARSAAANPSLPAAAIERILAAAGL